MVEVEPLKSIMENTRVARNGRAYTWEEFQAFYGTAALWFWSKAGAPEHSQDSEEQEAGAPEHNHPSQEQDAGEPEHMGEIDNMESREHHNHHYHATPVTQLRILRMRNGFNCAAPAFPKAAPPPLPPQDHVWHHMLKWRALTIQLINCKVAGNRMQVHQELIEGWRQTGRLTQTCLTIARRNAPPGKQC